MSNATFRSVAAALMRHLDTLAWDAYEDGAECHRQDPLDPFVNESYDRYVVLEGRAAALEHNFTIDPSYSDDTIPF